ncbi:MAG: GNAT family N-acetyltransferase [Planctomycetota bacterium]
MPDPIQLRPFEDGDLRSVAEIYVDAVHALATEHYDAAQREAWAPRVIDMDRWGTRLDGLRTVVATRAGRVVGFVAWTEDGYLDLLYVHPDVARAGLGARLVAVVEDDVAGRGAETVWARASDVSRPLFTKLGYDVGRVEEVDVRGATLRNTVVEKRIASAPPPT